MIMREPPAEELGAPPPPPPPPPVTLPVLCLQFANPDFTQPISEVVDEVIQNCPIDVRRPLYKVSRRVVMETGPLCVFLILRSLVSQRRMEGALRSPLLFVTPPFSSPQSPAHPSVTGIKEYSGIIPTSSNQALWLVRWQAAAAAIGRFSGGGGTRARRTCWSRVCGASHPALWFPVRTSSCREVPPCSGTSGGACRGT